MRDLSKERGKTILISSHILSEIDLLADDIGIIHEGNLLEESSMDELRKKKPEICFIPCIIYSNRGSDSGAEMRRSKLSY